MPKNTDLQAARDVRRAEAVLEDMQSLDCWASARLLRDCAADLDISVHAVALAVLSGEHLTAPDRTGPGAPSIPTQRRRSAPS